MNDPSSLQTHPDANKTEEITSNQISDTPQDPFGSMLPTSEIMFGWTVMILKLCLVIFATLALLLERKYAIHMLVLFLLSLGLLISLHIVGKPAFAAQTIGEETETQSGEGMKKKE